MTAPTEDLIARLEAGEKGNALDVLIEIALFEPDQEYSACRANNAGTKVVYTLTDGRKATYSARDWSFGPERADTLAVLRARSALTGSAQG